MTERILVTGGAGFIGSHIVDALLARGETVRIFDNLEPQVHHGKAPDYLTDDAEFILGDLRDPTAIGRALMGVDVVIHCASLTGTGQSQYEVKRYTDANVQGTAHLLEGIQKVGSVRRVLSCGTMSSYGEGMYRCTEHGLMKGEDRALAQLQSHDWEMRCPQCNQQMEPVSTSETAPKQPRSIYALSKMMQEMMLFNVADAYGFEAVSLRLFNVYGPRHSLSNPYTGLIAIFLSQILSGGSPLVFEDGLQKRDFVNVHDVVQAFLRALDSEALPERVFNIASGVQHTVSEVAIAIADACNTHITPEILHRYRVGDIRHCFADIDKARDILGYKPIITLSEGIRQLAEWSRDQTHTDHVRDAVDQLRQKKLLV